MNDFAPATTPAPMNFQTDSGGGDGGQQQQQNTGGDSGQNQQNNGGQQQNNNGQEANNTGENPMNASFWDGSPSEGDGNASPSDPASGSQNQNDGATPNQGSPAQSFADMLKALPLADKLIDTDVQNALQNGDYDGFNAALQQNSQNTVQQSVIMSAKLVQEAMGRMEAQFNAKIESVMNSERTTNSLESAIPLANDKGVGPMIRMIHENSMKATKNDHAKAVEMTKMAMVQFNLTTGTGEGVKLEGGGQGGQQPQQKETNWTDELEIGR